MRKALIAVALLLMVVTAAWAVANTASRQYTMTISPASLSITTSTIPNGQVGVAYTFTMNATGGVAPYTWTATGLPSGLTMSTGGVISGTPTTSVTSASVTATVTDSQP